MGNSMIKFVPLVIVSISTIFLAILVPFLERVNYILRRDHEILDIKINQFKFNLILDSIQDSKMASSHGSHTILVELNSKHQNLMKKN